MRGNTNKAIITGILGQDGSYLSKLLLSKGYKIYGIDYKANLGFTNEELFRNFISLELDYKKVELINFEDIESIVEDGVEVYNFAGQSSVGESWKNPTATFKSNLDFYIELLERVKNFKVKVFQACSGEMYAPNKSKLNESSLIDPLSPYSISKYSAYKYGKILRETSGTFIVNGILFNHESKLRDSRFVTRKIIDGARSIKSGQQDYLELGNIDIFRDWGLAEDYVAVMWELMQRDEGDDIIISSGKSISLRQYIEFVFEYFDIKDYEKYIKVNPEFIRKNDIKKIETDPSKLNNLGLKLSPIGRENIGRLI